MKNLKKQLSIVFLVVALLSCGGSSETTPSIVKAPSPAIPPVSTKPVLTFSNQTNALNIKVNHSNALQQFLTEPMLFSAGVAVADYNNDGYLDMYFVAGSGGTNQLYQNQGDDTFIEVASEAGIAISGVKGSGPTFADIDGDGWLDLFVGAVDDDQYYLFQNNRNGTFTDITTSSGLLMTAANSVSSTFGDIDNDGDIDMFISHWGNPIASDKSLGIVWRNDTHNYVIKFVDISSELGMDTLYQGQIVDTSFVPSLSDIDSDGDIDLLLVSDSGKSKVLRNDGNKLTRTNDISVNDQFGMGSAVGDIDNDGDMDWYVTSIYAKASNSQSSNNTTSYNGNRLYINDGEGNFNNSAFVKRLDNGGWAWAACFADFDNDGLTDIFHVNGWGQSGLDFSQYQDDISRFYLQQNDGSFKESAAEVNVNEVKQGRGVICNDIDRDGDIDIITSNNDSNASFFRNELTTGHHYLTVQLQGNSPNTQALGAKIQVTPSTGSVQIKELRVDNNFVSTNAVEAHFGLGSQDLPVNITITWPNGVVTEHSAVAIDQLVRLQQPKQ
ncbi:CRTAC1 family protein [uncultured Paraglaciecola sp.]|uniref:CRTAC1 family protein n=1 Tax=uncultured Paraglaciecola sp. TaxID=1765024 RepID=UPI0025E56822|nr:CRTAC1 family protein [uncultured Paraglaciecola sp.]